MAPSEISPVFIPLFAATFVTNLAYVGCLFLLKSRMASANTEAFTGQIFGASPIELFRLLGFVFSGRHTACEDVAISRLTWAVRVLFIAGCVLTACVFILALGAV